MITILNRQEKVSRTEISNITGGQKQKHPMLFKISSRGIIWLKMARAYPKVVVNRAW